MDDNHEIIIGISDASNRSNQAENDYDNINTKIIIKYPDDNEKEKDEQTTGNDNDDNNLEIISPSQALRKDIGGKHQVKGTITSISKPFKMVMVIHFYCNHCKKIQDFIFPLPVFEIPQHFIPICKNCKKLGENRLFKPVYINAMSIEIQDSEIFNDLEMLPGFLFNQNTEGIRVGETVIVKGIINILNIKKRHFAYFYTESIQYLNREDFTLTESDIRINKKFVSIHKDHVIDKLVSMLDPSIVENDLAKKGVLISGVNTSEKIGEDSEHIDIFVYRSSRNWQNQNITKGY